MSFRTGERKDGSNYHYPVGGGSPYTPKDLEVKNNRKKTVCKEFFDDELDQCEYYTMRYCKDCEAKLNPKGQEELQGLGDIFGNNLPKERSESEIVADHLGISLSEVNDDVVADWRNRPRTIWVYLKDGSEMPIDMSPPYNFDTISQKLGVKRATIKSYSTTGPLMG